MLGHDEGLCEAAYLALAKKAGINVPEFSEYLSKLGIPVIDYPTKEYMSFNSITYDK